MNVFLDFSRADAAYEALVANCRPKLRWVHHHNTNKITQEELIKDFNTSTAEIKIVDITDGQVPKPLELTTERNLVAY